MRRLVPLLGLGLALLVAATSPRWLPFNMDEFVHYQPLGCLTAPVSEGLGEFRESCHLYDLRPAFVGRPLPLRSYLYIGSFPAAVFAPFRFLVDEPVAARLQGAVFLAAAALLAARYLRLPVRFPTLAGLLFPFFALSFVADEGPVGLSILLFLAALLLLRRAASVADTRARIAAACGAGVAVFLGLWVKLTFAWWLPALAVLSGREARASATPLRRLAAPLGAAALAAGLPALWLLTAIDGEGRPYFASISRAQLSADPGTAVAGAIRLMPFLADASQAATRTLELPSWPSDVLPLLLAAAIVAAALVRAPTARPELALWLGLFAATFAASLPSPFTQWPHHLALSAVFLVLALARALAALRRAAMVGAASAIVAVWLSLAVRLPEAAARPEASHDKDELLAFVRARSLDRTMLQVHTSWGTYYIAQLFGDRERAVVYLKSLPDELGPLRDVRATAERIGRPVLLVSARRLERIATADLAAVLGRPSRTFRFGSWWALVYLEDSSP